MHQESGSSCGIRSGIVYVSWKNPPCLITEQTLLSSLLQGLMGLSGQGVQPDACLPFLQMEEAAARVQFDSQLPQLVVRSARLRVHASELLSLVKVHSVLLCTDIGESTAHFGITERQSVNHVRNTKSPKDNLQDKYYSNHQKRV